MEIKYRYSKKEDCNDILSLLLMCFGSKITSETIENIENRYLLAYCDNKLIAMTVYQTIHILMVLKLIGRVVIRIIGVEELYLICWV